MRGIRQLDTVSDADGNLYRVTEVKADGCGHIIAILRGVNENGKTKRGRYKTASVAELAAYYELVNTEPKRH